MFLPFPWRARQKRDKTLGNGTGHFRQVPTVSGCKQGTYISAELRVAQFARQVPFKKSAGYRVSAPGHVLVECLGNAVEIDR